MLIIRESIFVMNLKEKVEQILKEKDRSVSWLAGQMDKTLEGFKLSLSKETLKYSDFMRMLEILDVPAGSFFSDNPSSSINQKAKGNNNVQGVNTNFSGGWNEKKEDYSRMPSTYYEKIIEGLEKQLADKEKIIQLLEKR